MNIRLPQSIETYLRAANAQVDQVEHILMESGHTALQI